MKTVKNNLKNCSSAGIISSVFVLTGMPGETEEDVDEYIKNISELAKYIDQLHLANDFELIRGIYFYNNHEKFNIEFKMPVEEIEKNFTLTVPKELWYCREPYLDTHIAEKRLLRIANEFKKQRIPITSAIELPNEEVLN
jgi:radical SAM superfamily enzyme YgiQ (UPF0313 family)